MSGYDVAVVGLGVMGSATVCEIAARGHDVVGFERFGPDHRRGASSGDSRVLRALYFEHPRYVPLLERAYELWHELEARVDAPLVEETGGLMLGPADGHVVPGCRRSGRDHALAYEELTARDVARRFPAFRVPDGTAALLDPRAGFLRADACVDAFRSVARGAGADLRFSEPVRSWTVDDGGVRVVTDDGAYEAGRLVLTAGGWTGDLVPEIDDLLSLERQTLHFVRPQREAPFLGRRCPVWIYERGDGAFFYGTPTVGGRAKVARHHGGSPLTHPDELDRRVDAGEAREILEAVRPLLPELGGEVVGGRACFYTNTPDGDFLLARLPDAPRVLLSSACSGHGFKFASVLGEIHADLALNGETSFDVSPFGLDRLA